MNCYKHTDREAVKNCSYCGAPLCEECAGNNMMCKNCIEKQNNSAKKIATIKLVFGIVDLFLFLELVVLTILKSLFGGFDVGFLVSGIVFSVVLLVSGIILIVIGSSVLQNRKIIDNKKNKYKGKFSNKI